MTRAFLTDLADHYLAEHPCETVSLYCPTTGATLHVHGDEDAVDLKAIRIAEFMVANPYPWVVAHSHRGRGFSEDDEDATIAGAILGKLLGCELIDHLAYDLLTGDWYSAAESMPELLCPEITAVVMERAKC